MRLTHVSTLNLLFIIFASSSKAVFAEDAVLDENAAVREDFFSFNAGSETFTDVVDIAITVSDENLSILKDHPAWKEWVEFDNLSIAQSTSADAPFSPDKIVASNSAGRIRIKGQSTLFVAGCEGHKNLPYTIKFDDGSFLGMENFYLRTHFNDASQMRDHASNEILRAVGLPHLRTRPVRLFLNGEYSGFYTLIEAPDQDYVMQRSFGTFDPEQVGLFKMKADSNPRLCPQVFSTSIVDPDSPVPDVPYYERGRHRDDLSISEAVTFDERGPECGVFYGEQQEKVRRDVVRQFFEYDQSCSVTMVEADQVSRDFGKKSIEDSMINFLETYYDGENDDLTDFVDVDQWLQNIAFMAIVVHTDSPMYSPNNWYLATANGGNRDWKIFQYDHTDILLQQQTFTTIAPQCAPKMVYWPILKPWAGYLNSIPTLGRILNNEKNMELYLTHVREQMNVITNGKIVEELHNYLETIAAYASKDDYFTRYYETLEDFKKVELTNDNSQHNIFNNPFLPSLRVRLEEVQKQLDAIDSGTLPRNGKYDYRSTCPDWRNPEVEIEPTFITADCPIPGCDGDGVDCFGKWCGDGEFMSEFCTLLGANECASCFPHSTCGSALEVEVESKLLVPNPTTCGPDIAAECEMFLDCYDPELGLCNFLGENYNNECRAISEKCAPCFPNSRCGSADPAPEPAGLEPAPPATSDIKPEIDALDDSGPEALPSASGSSHSSLEWISTLLPLGLLCSLMVVA